MNSLDQLIAFPEEQLLLNNGVTTIVSVASNGSQGNGSSGFPRISGDGRYVVFMSWADNLVSGDTNKVDDIFVHDRVTGQTSRVSEDTQGSQGNGPSGFPSINADGRYVVFMSWADNLVSEDTNKVCDIFVHDQLTAVTSRVSEDSSGIQGNGSSGFPRISGDGRYVVFESWADNLVSGDTNQSWDIFLHDRTTEETTQVSLASDGSQGNFDSGMPSISADGRYVSFTSLASNLVSGDTNEVGDIFVHDRITGITSRVSVATDSSQGNDYSVASDLSEDGRYVVFESLASNLVSGDTNESRDVFIHDRMTQETNRVSIATDGSQGNSDSGIASISADGRYVSFTSFASNLVSGDTNGVLDVFVHDRITGVTSRVSETDNRIQGNGPSMFSSLSADGRDLVFYSGADNLVVGDNNDWFDIFVHQRNGNPSSWSDFNKDGITDLIYYNRQNGNSQAALLNSQNQVSQTPSLPSESGWKPSGTVDWDGDGNLDLLENNQTLGGTRVVLLNSALQQKSPPVPLPGGGGFQSVGTADVDNDGSQDYLYFQDNNSQFGSGVYLTKGSNDTSQWEFVELPGGPDWYVIAGADMNNDGADDLLWYNPRNQWNVAGVSLQQQTFNGRKFLIPQQWFGVPSTDGWIPRGVGDFNRDGFADFMLQNQTDDSTGAFLMTSSGVISSNIAASWPGWVNLPSQAGSDTIV